MLDGRRDGPATGHVPALDVDAPRCRRVAGSATRRIDERKACGTGRAASASGHARVCAGCAMGAVVAQHEPAPRPTAPSPPRGSRPGGAPPCCRRRPVATQPTSRNSNVLGSHATRCRIEGAMPRWMAVSPRVSRSFLSMCFGFVTMALQNIGRN
eukprot:scaffold22361_cov90-Isochrysis_galbana.AAC.1